MTATCAPCVAEGVASADCALELDADGTAATQTGNVPARTFAVSDVVDGEAACCAVPLDAAAGVDSAGASTAVAVPDGHTGVAGFTDGSGFALL